MKVDRRLVLHIADLANLKFNDREIADFTGQMNELLRYMEILDRLDTGGIEPTFYSLEGTEGRLREDGVEASISPEDALKNAPDAGRGHFRVPKIIT